MTTNGKPTFPNHDRETRFWLSTRDRADCLECAGHGCTFCYQTGKQLSREDLLLADSQADGERKSDWTDHAAKDAKCLTPAQARIARGECPTCGGSGREWGNVCSDCRGSGKFHSPDDEPEGEDSQFTGGSLYSSDSMAAVQRIGK